MLCDGEVEAVVDLVVDPLADGVTVIVSDIDVV